MDQQRFLNRDLSWLEFNRRVLAQALDERTPLLERVRFLGIFGSNLDEFFMKRVGGLQRQSIAGIDTSPLRLAIRRTVLPMLATQAECFRNQIRPALAREGIHLLRWSDLSPAQRAAADAHFRAQVFPVLTPLAVDPGHPFPLVSNLSTSLGVLLRHPERADKPLFARVKVPPMLPQWVCVERGEDDDSASYVSLVQMVENNLERLFPGMEILATLAFRVTRNSDVERDEEDAEDLLEMVTEELRERRFAKVVRLELGSSPDPLIRRFIMDELELTEEDVYEGPGGLDYTTLQAIADLNRPPLKYEPWSPVVPKAIAESDGNLFGLLRSTDLLVHHPYESFSASVLHFIQEAVDDPRVLAIKMTLYRTGEGSPFVPLLIRAAESGKQVACLVELKARFDEARNIRVARSLESAGVHVVYGIVGLKTHCKLALVVRQEPDAVRGYVHVGTGNYHVKTAHLYTDVGLFTARREYVDDALHLFNYLTGRSLHRDFARLLVAPLRMKEAFLARIQREAAHARAGRPARIVAKMNSLEDRQICEALYEASQAGVPVDLIVRGFCVLRPQVPGMSERIRVVSVVGRFLEHSRVFHFANGHDDPLDGEFFISSADWMVRNLEHRVEAAAPVEQRSLRARLWELLSLTLDDRRQAWELQPDGSYVARTTGEADEGPGVQAKLMELTRQRVLSSG